MYIEKKKIGAKVYNYLKASFRVNNKVKTKTIAYLGKEPMTKKEIEDKIVNIPTSAIETAKKELKEDIINVNNLFLTKEQLGRLNQIRKDFTRKLKKLDVKLIDDMFKDFKTHYIYNTNSIEGNTLTLEETNLLLNENITPKGKDLREIYDHINEKETFDYILKECMSKPIKCKLKGNEKLKNEKFKENGFRNEKFKINAELIIKIHSMLLKNIDQRTGAFRRHNVRVFGADFETTDAQYVHIDISLLLKWYNKNKRKLNPLILAAVFHEKFERIHPFYDGNGRTGRMLLNMILLKNSLPPLIIKNKDRKVYYSVLSKGHKAALTKTEPEHYKDIVSFCHKQLLATYDNLFSKWG